MIKKIKTDKYIISFNTNTGQEILDGINNNPDPFILEYPSLLDIGIMGHCSNKCKFCYQGNNKQPHMSLENFKRIIDESKYLVNQVALGGRGSPNEHPNFKEIIEYCVKNNVVPNYTTSGKNLTDEQIEISKNCGGVAVSMYNKDYTFNSLKRLIDSGITTNIHYVMSNKSFPKIRKLLRGEDIWNKKVNLEKLNAVVLLLFKPQGRGKYLRDWILFKKYINSFSKIIKSMHKRKRIKFGIGMDSCCICKIAQTRKLTEFEKLYTDTCEAARMSCYISPDMKLVPCSFGDPNIYGVSLENKTIKEAWDTGESFKNFRELLKNNPEKCPFGL